jgi:hypothetical protein
MQIFCISRITYLLHICKRYASVDFAGNKTFFQMCTRQRLCFRTFSFRYFFTIFTPDVLRLPFSSVSARKGTIMSWVPRSSRQFDFGYCSQESEETVSSQRRSVYGDQTAHGSNVFMDQQSSRIHQSAVVSGVLYVSATDGHRLRGFNWPQNKKCRAEWN